MLYHVIHYSSGLIVVPVIAGTALLVLWAIGGYWALLCVFLISISTDYLPKLLRKYNQERQLALARRDERKTNLDDVYGRVIHNINQVLSRPFSSGIENLKQVDLRIVRDRSEMLFFPSIGFGAKFCTWLKTISGNHENSVNKLAEDNIYADIGSYNLSTSKDSKSSATTRDRQRAATTDSKRQYFDDKKDQKDSQRDPSKEKSAAVLEAERTLGAILKPGSAAASAAVSTGDQYQVKGAS